MKKHAEITMQTKKNLIDAFWQIYRTERIEKITVKDITTKAGYNRGTFYEYFKDVYDILEQLENSVLPNLSNHHFGAHHRKKQMTEQEAILHFNQFSEIYQERSNYYVVLLGDNGDPAFQGKLKNVLRPPLKAYFSEYSDGDDFALEYTVEYILSALIGVLNYGFTREENPSIEKFMQLICHLMFNGVVKQSI